jgi:hypothetical protein
MDVQLEEDISTVGTLDWYQFAVTDAVRFLKNCHAATDEAEHYTRINTQW